MAEAPKYRLNQTSYIGDIMYLAGLEGPVDRETGELKPVYFIDKDSKYKPGPHWEPVNDAAKAIAAKHGIEYTGEVPDSMDKLLPQLELAKANKEKSDQDAVGAGVVKALIEHGIIKVPKKAVAETLQPAEI